jgi:hypothetical protein
LQAAAAARGSGKLCAGDKCSGERTRLVRLSRGEAAQGEHEVRGRGGENV